VGCSCTPPAAATAALRLGYRFVTSVAERLSG
jgi:hypothetical protein